MARPFIRIPHYNPMRNLIIHVLAALLGVTVAWTPLQAESPKQSYDKGYRYHLKGRYSDAARFYTTAINGNPSFVQAYQMRAAAYHSLKEYELSLQDYSKVIELGEKFFKAVTHFNRGTVYYETGNYNAAIMDFSWAISYNRRMAIAYVHRGIAKGRIGDKNGQINDFVSAARYGDFEVRGWLEQHAPHVLTRK